MLLKKLFIGFLVLLVIVPVAILIFINPILEKAKPLLLETVSKTLESNVTAGKIAVSIFPVPSFLLEDIKLSSDTGDLILKSAKIEVSLSKIFKKQVSLVSIEIANALINGSLEKDGSIKIKGLKLPKKAGTLQDPKSTEIVPVKAEPTKEETPLDVSIENLKVTDIEILLTNNKLPQIPEKKRDLAVRLDSLELKKIEEKASLKVLAKIDESKINFDGELNTYKLNSPNIVPSGELSASFKDLIPIFNFLGQDQNPPPITNLDVNTTVKLPAIKVNSIDGLFAEQKFKLTGDLLDVKQGGGNFIFEMPVITFAALNTFLKNPTLENYSGSLKDLKCDLALSGKESVESKCFLGASDINTVPFKIDLLHLKSMLTEPKEIDISSLVVTLGSGQLDTKVRLIPGKNTDLNLHGKNLSITDLLKLNPDKNSREKGILGTITKLESAIKLVGQNKSGNFSVNISPFSIKGFNLFKKVSDALEVVPGLSVSLVSALPQSYGVVLLSQNSEFENVKAEGDINNSKITLKSYEARSKGYSVNGKGTLDNGEIDLKLTLVIEKDLVAALESSQPKFGKLKNPDGTIVLPLEIHKSKDGTPIVIPDVKNLLKQQIGIQAREGAKKALDKVSPGLGGLVDGLLN